MIRQIREFLFENQDIKYQSFQCALIPSVDQSAVIGVRTPILRKYAKKIAKNPEISCFLDDLPHKYYEENNLHAFLIEQITDENELVSRLDAFIPFVDNWATCDSMKPKIFKSSPALALDIAYRYMKSEHEYTVRFGIGILMYFFLDDNFELKYLEDVSRIRSDKYYINMMIAWYFATALCKRYDESVKYLEDCRLDPWVHNKTISKACDSFRVDDEVKRYLRGLRV